jgi:hypothetical protein
MGMRRNAWRHLIGGTVRNLSSWPLDPVVDDLSRFPKGFGRGRKRHRCRQPQPILIVDRNNEAGLASEIETMEMVSLRPEDHGLPSTFRSHVVTRHDQKLPSIIRIAAAAFGFLTLIQLFEGPERYGASIRFETMPSRPSLQIALKISAPSPDLPIRGKSVLNWDR